MGERLPAFILGALAAGVGVLLWFPAVRLPFAKYRDGMYRSMPWLQRIPGVRALYGDTGQRIVIRIVGAGFVLFGVLVMTGVLDMR
jgi:hypothetical protein